MACEWTEAKQGNRFYLTRLGMADNRIKVKFEERNVCGYRSMYLTKVPSSWISKGYVVECLDRDGGTNEQTKLKECDTTVRRSY